MAPGMQRDLGNRLRSSLRFLGSSPSPARSPLLLLPPAVRVAGRRLLDPARRRLFRRFRLPRRVPQHLLG